MLKSLRIASFLAAGILTSMAQLAIAAPPAWAPGRVLVQPRTGLSESDLQKVLRKAGANGVARRIEHINVHVVNVPPQAEAAVARALSHNPHIKFAEVDRALQLQQTANDPYFGSAWHLPKIGTPTAWDQASGMGVTVAILDTGVDGTHPDLVGRLVSGWNAVDRGFDTSDINGHGTRVAGVVAANTNNGVGVASIAWSARLMPVRVTNGSDGYAYYSDIATGLTWAADHGARVANISYDATASSSISSAAQYMNSKGGVVAVAAGNSGSDLGYADNPYMISVSATTSSDQKASWSSYGRYVDISAPGAGIWTTSRGGGYGAASGTSFASPATAGVLALIKSVNSSLAPSEVEDVLESSAVDLGSAGYDTYYGAGRIDAAAAVRAALSTSSVDTQSPSVSITSPGDGANVSGLVPVDASAQDNVGVVKVDLYASGRLVGSDVTAPYQFSWDSSTASNGNVTLVAYGYDAAGNQAQNQVSVNVGNTNSDATAPTVTINSPSSGSTVSGTVSISASASDAGGVSQMQVLVDGALRCAAGGASISCSWNTRKSSAGSHTISVRATDNSGNTSSASESVTVASSGSKGNGGGKTSGGGNGKGHNK